jgi:hypothetical protein
VERDEHGKLSYDVQLRAPEDKRRRVQSFVGAAAESFGSGTTSARKPPKSRFSRSGDDRSSLAMMGHNFHRQTIWGTLNIKTSSHL